MVETRIPDAPAPEVMPGASNAPPPKGWLPHPRLSVALLLLWLLLVNSLHPRMVVLGVVWALLVPLFTRVFLPSTPRVCSWPTLLRFVPLFLWDVLVANLAVAWLIVNVARPVRPAWIVIPLDLTDPYAITTLASVISLTPGTVSSQLGPGRRTLLVHVLDTADPEAEVARIKERYEAPLKEIFEC